MQTPAPADRREEFSPPFTGEPRSAWPRQENFATPGESRNEPIPIRVNTRDPISAFGVLAQLRYQPEVVIADADVRPAVLVAILDNTDEDAVRWLKAMHADGGLPIVLIIGRVDPGALVCLV